MYLSKLLFAALLALSQTFAQQQPDGVLVPFTSALPACASTCGPLFDVQGGCKDVTCFCGDARLSSFRQTGTAGVSAVCGAGSCTAAADLQRVQSWYTGFCGATTTNPTATTSANSGTAPSSSASSTSLPGSQKLSGTWLSRHLKWVIMIIIIVVGLILLWVGAWFFRRRYLRNREREIEMSPPVAWGPQQAHTGQGGYQYGDGVVDSGSSVPGAAGGHHKEALASEIPAHGKRLSKSHMGWFKANR